MLTITENLSIPEDELVFTASRSSGPGGQNVNKVSTRVTLSFDVDRSPSLSEYQRRMIRTRLSTRINKEGLLRIVSQKTSSQLENRQLAVERFIALMQSALRPIPVRKKTRKPRSADHRRLKEKKQKSQIKQFRSRRMENDSD